MFFLSLFALVVLGLAALDFFLGIRTIPSLVDVEPLPQSFGLPKISVIVPARNEARAVETALVSLLNQDYPDLEVWALDDRSNDETGLILDRLQKTNPRLRARHIRELPAGWLGKNHALWTGAKEANGEYLLFTDADIVMAPTTLRRAVTFMKSKQLDHLALLPDVTMPNVFLRTFAASFALFFSFYSRPWKARDPRSRAHIGIGAFNLVRAKAYQEAGTHEAIRLRPDDDMKLGKILKRAGFRQDVASGSSLITVEWYNSLGELIYGLEKNSFSGLEYRVALLVLASLMQLVTFIWPLVGLFVSSGAAFCLNIGSVVLIAAFYLTQSRFFKLSLFTLALFPFAVMLFLYIIWRASLNTLYRGGIDWRGTFYSLRQLKSNKI